MVFCFKIGGHACKARFSFERVGPQKLTGELSCGFALERAGLLALDLEKRVQYFSPEQARGDTTTPASDVYGLGLVLYEALTGRRPWSGETSAAIALARIGAPAPSARALRPEVPVALDSVVMRAMDPDPLAALSRRHGARDRARTTARRSGAAARARSRGRGRAMPRPAHRRLLLRR